MASRILSGLGLKAFWGNGFDGWDAEMDNNLLLLSNLAQARAISATTTLPGSPTNGDIYLVKVGDANATKIAIRDAGAWVYVTPLTGWRVYVTDVGAFHTFNGTIWVSEDTAWTVYTPVPTPGSGAVTAFGTCTGRHWKKGKTCAVQLRIPITTNGTGATNISATLPFTAAAFSNILHGKETGVSKKALIGEVAASAASVVITNYDNTYPGANNAVLTLSGIFETT